MTEEYEWEELAEDAISDLKKFIDLENLFINKEHELKEKLISYDYVLIHLEEERIPFENKVADNLNARIIKKLKKIIKFIESDKTREWHIEQEEKHLSGKIKEDISHKNWKAVKKHTQSGERQEEKALKLQGHELRKLHKKFNDLRRTIERELLNPKKKEYYTTEIRRYFHEIYKLVKAYEKVFKDLRRKEKLLYKKLKKDSKEIGS